MYQEDFGKIVHVYLPTEHFVWSLPNIFATALDPRTCVTSPSFSYCEETWRLAVIKSHNETSMGLFLWCSQPPKQLFFAQLQLMHHRLRETPRYSGKVNLDGNIGCWTFVECPTDECWERGVSPAGVLTFACEIRRLAEARRSLPNANVAEGNEDVAVVNEDVAEVNEDVEENVTQNETKSPLKRKGVFKLSEDLKRFYQERQACDVIIKAGGREFPVNKAILVARSPALAAMFTHDMAEKNSGRVDITDCSAEAFDIFLLYLYSGELENIGAMTIFDVYNAAVKYHVYDLVEECALYLGHSLSVENFCNIMTLALLHDDEKMKISATNFFCQNLKQIVKTRPWEIFLSENPLEANELYKTAIHA